MMIAEFHWSTSSCFVVAIIFVLCCRVCRAILRRGGYLSRMLHTACPFSVVFTLTVSCSLESDSAFELGSFLETGAGAPCLQGFRQWLQSHETAQSQQHLFSTQPLVATTDSRISDHPCSAGSGVKT